MGNVDAGHQRDAIDALRVVKMSWFRRAGTYQKLGIDIHLLNGDIWSHTDWAGTCG